MISIAYWALQESFWRFKIPEHKLDVPVLVVGHVSEPRVAFDRPSLSFGKVLVGGRTHATINLINSEHMPFQFDLDKASYDASPARLESTGLAAKPVWCVCCCHVTCAMQHVGCYVIISCYSALTPPAHKCKTGLAFQLVANSA